MLAAVLGSLVAGASAASAVPTHLPILALEDSNGLASPPPPLRDWPSNFSAFNPSLLPVGLAEALVFFRVSNMHFCHDGSWRDRMREQTHLRSYIGVATLDAASLATSDARVLSGASALFRSEGEACERRDWLEAGGGIAGTFSGPEDPRAVWSPRTPRAPWLLTSAWSADCRTLGMHLIRLPPTAKAASAAAAAEATAAAVRPALQQVPLTVTGWPAGAPMKSPDREPLQKNWLPFVHDGTLYAEYSIEPRVVLRIDPYSGECTLVGRCGHICSATCPSGLGNKAKADATADGPPAEAGTVFASFPPLATLAHEHGRVSGGAPPVHVPEYKVYVGLAHVKASKQSPRLLGTSRMPYRHVFYAFADEPPFDVVAAGESFVLPEPPPPPGGRRVKPTVQFAAGMMLAPGGRDLLISYSVRDCGARVLRRRLEEVLTDLGIGG